jgi:hypothetical protein
MEKTKVKFPRFTQAERLRLIFGPHSSALEDDDLADIRRKLDEGRFVLAWDDDNPADCFPTLGALRSVKILPHHDAHFTVETEGGMELTYKHAVLIHSEELPLMVSGGGGLFGVHPTVGRYVGMFASPTGQTICALERTEPDHCILHYEPQNIAFLSDVTFGIEKEVANG